MNGQSAALGFIVLFVGHVMHESSERCARIPRVMMWIARGLVGGLVGGGMGHVRRHTRATDRPTISINQRMNESTNDRDQGVGGGHAAGPHQQRLVRHLPPQARAHRVQLGGPLHPRLGHQVRGCVRAHALVVAVVLPWPPRPEVCRPGISMDCPLPIPDASHPSTHHLQQAAGRADVPAGERPLLDPRRAPRAEPPGAFIFYFFLGLRWLGCCCCCCCCCCCVCVGGGWGLRWLACCLLAGRSISMRLVPSPPLPSVVGLLTVDRPISRSDRSFSVSVRAGLWDMPTQPTHPQLPITRRPGTTRA